MNADIPQQEDTIREKIMRAAIDVIEREGIHGATVRTIAKEAGVNSAAINYYFGTKDNLVNIVMKRSLDEGLINNLQEIIELRDLPPREKISLFMDTILIGCIRWPQVTRTHLYKPFMEGDYSGEIVGRFHQLMDNLYDLISHQYQKQDQAKIKLALVQILSSIMFTGLIPGLFTPSLEKDFLTSEASQKRFVRSLMDRLLPE